MTFLNPFALLLLLTVPILVLLYFLKLKRPNIKVPSTLLWQKVIEDMRVNSPFQRLKRNILMILQLLALLAVIIALARPLLRIREQAGESLIALVDTSASMGAVEANGKTRLDNARAELARLADGLPKDGEMMLVSFDTRAKVVCSFSSNKRRLKEAIAAMVGTECPTSIEPALAIAKSIAGSRDHPRIILFSDGAFQLPAGGGELPVPVEYRQMGTPRPNVAVTGLDIRRSVNRRNKIEMFVAVENFSDKPQEGGMTVYLDDKLLDSKYLSVGPGETLSQIFEASLPAGGNVKVSFDVKDSLECDNHAWKVVDPPLARRILIVGHNTFFLERVFGSVPGTECTVISPEAYGGTAVEGFFAVVWNSVAVPEIAPCNNIYLGCSPRVPGLVLGDKVDAPDIVDWNNLHPVNRFLDFDNLLIASASVMTLPEQAITVLRSSRTPLIGLFESDQGGTCVVAGFDPMRSNWPLLISFPIFLNNCLDYFQEQRARKLNENIRTGQIITVQGSAVEPTIRRPGGQVVSMRKNEGGDYGFAGVDACGVYAVGEKAGTARSIAANLFNRNESQLTPVTIAALGGQKVEAVRAGRQTNVEYWRYLAIACALVLLLEWVVYHRRWFA